MRHWLAYAEHLKSSDVTNAAVDGVELPGEGCDTSAPRMQIHKSGIIIGRWNVPIINVRFCWIKGIALRAGAQLTPPSFALILRGES